jgi:hypothetical protein
VCDQTCLLARSSSAITIIIGFVVRNLHVRSLATRQRARNLGSHRRRLRSLADARRATRVCQALGESSQAVSSSVAALGRRILPPVRTPRRHRLMGKPWCERPRCHGRRVALRLNGWGRSHHGLRVTERCRWRGDGGRIGTAVLAAICVRIRVAFSSQIPSTIRGNFWARSWRRMCGGAGCQSGRRPSRVSS